MLRQAGAPPRPREAMPARTPNLATWDSGRPRPAAAWRRRLTAVALAACLSALCAAATSAGLAAAQTYPIVSSELHYSSYDIWIQWDSAVPNKCVGSEPLYISEPAAPGTYPVFIYTHGTLADWGGNFEGQRIAQMAAAEGFVAAAPTYDSWLTMSPSGVASQAQCIYGGSSTTDVIGQVCALAEANCSQGVVVGGFSQGGAIAGLAANYSPLVRAAWLMGVSGPVFPEGLAAPAGTRVLPNDKLRLDVGQTDVQTGPSTFELSALNALTGLNCSQLHCIQPNGSGFYVVQNSEVADGVADHCWFQSVNLAVPSNSCTWNPTWDPGFVAPSTTPWSLPTSLNWLSRQLAPETSQALSARRSRAMRVSAVRAAGRP